MSAGVRLRRAALAFAGCSLVVIVLSAQLGPGWRAAGELPPLAPEPAGPMPKGAGLPTERVTAEVAGRPAWIDRPVAVDGARPGVVLVAGSGPSSRDGMADLAGALAADGVVVIRYDKRTEGYGALHRDFGGLADDAAAAADVLAASPGVDPARVGGLGFSEGGWVLPLATQRHPDRFAFAVLASAPIVSPMDQVAWGADRALSWAPSAVRRIPAAFLSSGRQTVDYGDTDITPALAALRVPVLGLWGAEDPTVPVNEAIRRARAAITAPFTAVVLPNAGHGLPVDSGYPHEVARWIADGPGADRVVGVEPRSALGVATSPSPRWYHQPAVQVATSLTVAVLVGLLPVHRRRSRAPIRRLSTSRS